MSANEGLVDRIVRVVLGIVLLYLWLGHVVTGTLALILGIVGVILLITGIIGYCPLYTLVGFSTKK